MSSRPPTTPGPDGGGGAFGRLPAEGGDTIDPPGADAGGAELPGGAVVEDVGFFPDVVVVGLVDVVLSGSGSGSAITVVVVVGGGAVVVVGRRVVVVVAGGRVVVVVAGG